jgi:hypothetical protein
MQAGELLTGLLGVVAFGCLCVCLAIRKPRPGPDLQELEKMAREEEERQVHEYRETRCS